MKTATPEQATVKAVIAYAEKLEHWRACGAERFVYFIQEHGSPDGLVKIGIANDPETRRLELQCGNGRRLIIREIIPGGQPVEQQLHLGFHQYRLEGEWFEAGQALVAFAAGLSDRVFAFHAERGVLPVAWSYDWTPMSMLDLMPYIDAELVSSGKKGGAGRGNGAGLLGASAAQIVREAVIERRTR